MPGEIGALTPLVTLSRSGIKRDGTEFEGDYYVDGKWVRWDRGFPRKMGGYRELARNLTGPVRGMASQYQTGVINLFTGSTTKLEMTSLNSTTGQPLGPPTSRMPGGFTSNANYLWSMAVMYNSAGANNALLVHAAPNALDIASDTAAASYYGDVTTTAAMTAITTGTTPNVSGGIMVLHPYFVRFGSAGFVGWSDANQPAALGTGDAGEARVTAQKIVVGKVLRGGAGYSPAGLLWSLDSLLRMSYIGGTAIFSFDTISDQTSIIAQNSVVEYDGIYYWIGDGRFFMFNGVVQEMPNLLNRNYFFDNLNYAYANRIYGYKIPRWGEIRWAYPRGTATECTHEIVFNVRESAMAGYPVWYDTELPNSGRCFANNDTLARYPFAIGVTDTTGSGGNGYQLWQHEFGADEVTAAGAVNAIESYFETADITLPIAGTPQMQQQDSWVSLLRVEPDFVLSGEMSLLVRGRAYAMSPMVDGQTYTFPNASVTLGNQRYMIPTKETFRQMRLRFTSNVQGGDYQMGQVLAFFDAGDSHQ